MGTLHEGRLVVLLFCLAGIPANFIYFFSAFNLSFSSFGQSALFFRIFISPYMFIAVWEILIILFANRIADSFDGMKHIVSLISVRYNLYFGITAAIFVFMFVFPLFSPIVTSLVFGSLIWRLFTARLDWSKREKTPSWVLLPVILVMLVPLAAAVYFYIIFIPQAITFWEGPYIGNVVPILQALAKVTATAITLGSLIYLAEFGTSEYELVLGYDEQRPRSVGYVRALEVFFFVVFLYVYVANFNVVLFGFVVSAFNIIQYTVIGINILIILGNLRNRNKIAGAGRSIVSYFLIIILFLFSVVGNYTAESIILIFSSLIYIIAFVIIFARTDTD